MQVSIVTLSSMSLSNTHCLHSGPAAEQLTEAGDGVGAVVPLGYTHLLTCAVRV